VPGIRLYTQHRGWADSHWRFGGSVFDGFVVLARAAPTLRRVVLTVGSSELYGFRRLIDRVRAVLPPEVEVLWQTGSTPVSDLPIDGVAQLPPLELAAAMAQADVVIAHAGVGTAITALESGRRPLLVPREHAHGEHVDDHQLQLAANLAAAGLASVRRVEELALADIEAAASWTVEARSNPPRFALA
jgi:UDP-N-acetylglucosamine transferase subunit ALG13